MKQNKLPVVPADIWRKFHVCHQWEKGTLDQADLEYTWEWWDWVLYALCGPNQCKKTFQMGVECTCTVWGLGWNSQSKKSNFRWWYLLIIDPIIQQLFLRFDRGQWQPETIHWYHMRCPLQVFTKKRISKFHKLFVYLLLGVILSKQSNYF